MATGRQALRLGLGLLLLAACPLLGKGCRQGTPAKPPLHQAIERHDLEGVKALIASGADVNQIDPSLGIHGETPLQEALSVGAPLAIFELLADHGADIRYPGGGLLHAAAWRDRRDVAVFLLDRGVDVNQRGPNGTTALHWAAKLGNVQMSQLLLARGADTGVVESLRRTPLQMVFETPSTESALAAAGVLLGAMSLTPSEFNEAITDPLSHTGLLHLTARAGDLKLAEHLVQGGAKIDARDSFDRTPLELAAEAGHERLVRYFVLQGANLEGPARYGTVLQTALWVGKGNMAALFRDLGVAPSNACTAAGLGAVAQLRGFLEKAPEVFQVPGDPHGNTPLHYAARCGQPEALALLLRHGASVSKENVSGRTPLHEAAAGGHLGTAVPLVEGGAAVNARDRSGSTPLHEAARVGAIDVMGLLTEHGANVNERDGPGCTPLYAAADLGRPAAIELLLDNGARIDERDRTTRTPLCLAAMLGHEDVVRVLIQRGADVNARTSDGGSPLLEACFPRGMMSRLSEGQVACARLLIEAGADVKAANSWGGTALYGAASAAEGPLIRLLLARGAGTGKPDDWVDWLPRDRRHQYRDLMEP